MLSFGTAGAIVPPVVSIRNLFCFTVRGTDVESIPTAQAQTMPPFQELDAAASGRWSLRNRTLPFCQCACAQMVVVG